MWDYSTLQFAAQECLFSRRPAFQNGQASPSDEVQRQRKQTLAAAIALSWDHKTVTILCPFCHKTHSHGIDHFGHDPESGKPSQDDNGRYIYRGPSPTRCESRQAHCSHEIPGGVQYSILFPFEEDERVSGLSFEIDVDGEREQFHTIGLELPLSEAPMRQRTETFEEQQLRTLLESMRVDDGSDEEGRAAILIASAAVSGNTAELNTLLRMSGNRSELLQWQGDNGTTLLGLAVPNGHLQTVDFLLENGADVNVGDFKGRTPLMEAVLWGRPVIVKRLLEAHALTDLVDNAGRKAIDFAEECETNDEERSQRHIKYTENPVDAKRRRRLIKGLLGYSFEPTRLRTIPLDDLSDAYFYKSTQANTISFVIPTAGIRISSPKKTAAFLHRGGPYPIISILSGRSEGPSDQEYLPPGEGFERLNPGHWMAETMRIAGSFGFTFEAHSRDDIQIPGSFNAGHAESMLMCFFVKKNYIFRDYDDGHIVEDDFLQLFLLQPRIRQAQIIVSKAPCPSCRALRRRIETRLGIHFDIRDIQTR